MDKNIGIYKIENIINGKKYIGSSINIDKRFYRHKNDLINNKHNNIHLQRDFNKYSLYDFKFECIEICDVNNIKKIEQKYLDKIFEIKNNNNIYYNIGKQSSGGDNISQHPDNKLIKEKISNGLYNRYNNESEEDKKRRRKNLLGEKNPNYGNIWDNEQRSKMSNQRKGLPSKNKGKNFEDIYGKEKSCKLKKILSENMKKRTGEKNPNYGNTCSDELKEYYSKKI